MDKDIICDETDIHFENNELKQKFNKLALKSDYFNRDNKIISRFVLLFCEKGKLFLKKPFIKSKLIIF